MATFTEAHSGDLAEVPAGGSFEIALRESPATGYRWELNTTGVSTAALVDDRFEPPTGVGGEGMHHWRFRAVHPGVAEIALSLRRSWAPGESARSFTLRVNVQH